MAEFWHYKGTGKVLIFSYVNSARATYLKFIKENDLKYKGNIHFFVFHFFGMKMTFYVTSKPGAE